MALPKFLKRPDPKNYPSSYRGRTDYKNDLKAWQNQVKVARKKGQSDLVIPKGEIRTGRRNPKTIAKEPQIKIGNKWVNKAEWEQQAREALKYDKKQKPHQHREIDQQGAINKVRETLAKQKKKENGDGKDKKVEKKNDNELTAFQKLEAQNKKLQKRIVELEKNGGIPANEGVPPKDENKPTTPVDNRTSRGRRLDEIPGWDASRGQINRGPINAFGLEIPQQPISPLIDVSKADALRGRLQDIQTQGQANRLRRSSQFYQRGGGGRALDMHMRNLPQFPQLQGQANATDAAVNNLANPTNAAVNNLANTTNYLRPPVNFTRSPVLQNTWNTKFGNFPSPGVEVFRGNVVPFGKNTA